MRLGGWQNSLICMKLSAQASTSFHCVCSPEWNSAKVFRAKHTRRQVCSLCVRRNFFVTIFVSATESSRTKSNRTEFVRLLAARKLCCWDKDFHKNSLERTKRFVAVATCRATCCSNLSHDLYTQSDFVAATCCSDMSPSVLRPYRLWNSLITRYWLNALENEATNPQGAVLNMRHPWVFYEVIVTSWKHWPAERKPRHVFWRTRLLDIWGCAETEKVLCAIDLFTDTATILN